MLLKTFTCNVTQRYEKMFFQYFCSFWVHTYHFEGVGGGGGITTQIAKFVILTSNSSHVRTNDGK